MTVTIRPLRIAILVNHPPNTTFWPEVKQAFVDSFDIVAPHAVLDFYDPIEAREYPDPSQYELIIFSGGKADASASEPWTLRLLDFVQTTVRETPDTKLFGICWGHQAIARALGGKVGTLPNGPVAGLVRINFTEAGKKFFPFAAEKGSYLASQFHLRLVAVPAPGFTALAEDNESFVSDSNKIISFQAHPEIGEGFSRQILEDDDTTYVEGKTPEEVNCMLEGIREPQDGLDILRRIIKWVDE